MSWIRLITLVTTLIHCAIVLQLCILADPARVTPCRSIYFKPGEAEDPVLFLGIRISRAGTKVISISRRPQNLQRTA